MWCACPFEILPKRGGNGSESTYLYGCAADNENALDRERKRGQLIVVVQCGHSLPNQPRARRSTAAPWQSTFQDSMFRKGCIRGWTVPFIYKCSVSVAKLIPRPSCGISYVKPLAIIWYVTCITFAYTQILPSWLTFYFITSDSYWLKKFLFIRTPWLVVHFCFP